MDLDTVTALEPASAAQWRPGDAWLAGGTWLFSEPQPAVSRLLDLQSFGWPALVADEDGLTIAATCTLAELAAWRGMFPAAEALFGPCCRALLGSTKVWHTATVGGNVCLALPAGPMTALTAALDGVAELWGPEQHVPILDFVTGPGQTVLRPGQLMRAIHLPARTLHARVAVRQISLSPVGRSAALVIGRRDVDGLTITVTGSTPRPVRLSDPSDIDTISDYYDDVHGDPRWREAMTRRFVREIAEELA